MRSMMPLIYFPDDLLTDSNSATIQLALYLRDAFSMPDIRDDAEDEPHKDAVQRFLANGANPTQGVCFPTSELGLSHSEVEARDISALRRVWAAGFMPPLGIVLQHPSHDPMLVKLMLEVKNIRLDDTYAVRSDSVATKTLLAFAISGGVVASVCALLVAGADPNAYASSFPYQGGYDMYAVSKKDAVANCSQPALFDACSAPVGGAGVVRALIAAGADVEGCDSMGRTVLVYALISLFNATASLSSPALVTAMVCEKLQIIEALLLSGADPSRSCVYPSVLYRPVDTLGYSEAVPEAIIGAAKLLLASGADFSPLALIHTATDKSTTYLDNVLMKTGGIDVIKFLVEHGAIDINLPMPSLYNFTILQSALVKEVFGCLLTLLSLGADPTLPLKYRCNIDSCAEFHYSESLIDALNTMIDHEERGTYQHAKFSVYRRLVKDWHNPDKVTARLRQRETFAAKGDMLRAEWKHRQRALAISAAPLD
jgi:ankyrin repeat protein